MQVQKFRLQRGWSQQQLAELSGLSARTIQRIENGKPASTESLKSLASVFEIDFSTLSSEPDMTASNPISHDEPAASAIDPDEQLALSKVRKIKKFYIHLMQYAIVITGLCILNLVTTPDKLWFYWPALGWGIGILSHAASVFQWAPFFGAQWERKQVEKQLGRKL
jgi:transcriptional regulator with XRE-family HTH domain